MESEGKTVLTWQTAYAGDFPVEAYEIFADGRIAGEVPHQPQVLKSRPFTFSYPKLAGNFSVVAVDARGNRAEANLV